MARRENAGVYYPLSLKVKGKRCIVVGGGAVAARKVQTMLECGAAVVVISPTLSRQLARLARVGTIEVLKRAYRTGDLAGARLAIAATDDVAVNARVAREGRRKGVLINVVDNAELSDFILPSLVRRGDLTVAISTAGRSPALARKLRTVLEQVLGAEYEQLVRLISEVRQDMREQGRKVEADAWQRSLDLGAILGRLKEGDFEAVKRDLAVSLGGPIDSR